MCKCAFPILCLWHPSVSATQTYCFKLIKQAECCQFNNWNNVACKVRNCKISYDKRDLTASDAVLFHVRDIKIDLIKLSNSLVEHRFKQRWIFFNHESIEYSFTDLSKLKNVFNWTMTYKLDSDIFVPYAYYFQKTGKNAEHNSSKDYSKGKDRLVSWVVSNCGRQRDKLVKKLMELIYSCSCIRGLCIKIFTK